MARVEGFEPPTAWFVARYSIQLSYTRVKTVINFILAVTTSCRGWLEWRVWKDYSRHPVLHPFGATLRMFQIVPYNLVEPPSEILECGACGRIRTSDRLVRSQVLYPAELHTRFTKQV